MTLLPTQYKELFISFQVGVYVSTAFSHCPLNIIKEELYPPPLTYEESNAIVHIIEKQIWSEEQIEKFTERQLKFF